MSKKDYNTKADYFYSFTKGALSSIPLAGGIVSEFFGLLVSAPAQLRKDEWLEDIYNRLIQLEKVDKQFSLDNLKNNEEFISVFIQAYQLSLKTHEEIKRNVLKNAVINSATYTITYSKQHTFLKLIDDMCERQIQILDFLAHPINYITSRQFLFNDLDTSLIIAFPEFKDNELLLDYFIEDLKRKKIIINKDKWEDIFSDEVVESAEKGSHIVRNYTFIGNLTSLGVEFLKYTLNI